MAQSELECANAALSKIGEEPITTLTVTATSPKTAVACAARLDNLRKKLLRSHPWNFAIKRKTLLPPASFAVSNVVWQSSQLVRITHATNTFALASYVTLEDVLGATLANGAFEVAVATSGGVTTDITVPEATTSALLGTYVSGGTIRQSPAFDYSYLYSLPTDCLRVITIDERQSSPEWRIEGGKILSNTDTSIQLRYVKDVTDYTEMDVDFYDCLSLLLAWDICNLITGDDQMKRALYTDLYGGDGKAGLLGSAKFDDAVEDSMQMVESNEWIASRFGGGFTNPIPGLDRWV